MSPQQPFRQQRHSKPPPTQEHRRMAPELSSQQLGLDSWRKKCETVTTQMVQAVMVLRKDSLGMNDRVSRLEAKSMSQPQATNDPRVQEMVMELKRQNQTMAEQIAVLQAENLKLTNAMKKIVSTLREMKMQQSQTQNSSQVGSQVGSPPPFPSVPPPEATQMQASNPFLPQSAQSYAQSKPERKEVYFQCKTSTNLSSTHSQANTVDLFATLESPYVDTPHPDAPQAQPSNNVFQGLAEVRKAS